MYTEEEFFQIIKDKTGWDFQDPNTEKRFGFISGACTPFMARGMQSASMSNYFEIWKMDDGLGMQAKIPCDTPEKMMEDILEFMNKPFSHRLVGEYDKLEQTG